MTLLLDYLHQDKQSFQTQFKETHTQLQTTQEELERKKKEILEAKEESRSKIAHQRSRLLTAKEQDAVEDKNLKIRQLEDEISQFRAKLKMKDDLILQLQQQLQQQQEQEHQQHATPIASNLLTTEISLKETLQQATSSLAVVLEQNTQLELEKIIAIEKLNLSEALQREIKAKLSHSESQMSSLTTHITKLESEVGEKIKEIEEKNQVIETFKSNSAQLQQQLDEFATVIQQFYQELTNCKNSANNNSSLIENYNNHINNASLARFSLDSLKSVINDFSKDNKLGFVESIGAVSKGLDLSTSEPAKELQLEEVNDRVCSVCACEQIDFALPPCNHAVMCQDCGQRWIRENRNCPTCHLPVFQKTSKTKIKINTGI